MLVKYKFLGKGARVPTRGSDCAAGYDLYALVEGEDNFEYIFPHKTTKVHTGLSIELPEGYFGAIFPRSGIATKYGLRLANCVGVIDQDYTGEVIVPIHNDTDEVRHISNGDRIAQLVLLPYQNITFEEVEELTETARGDGGFGSTGVSNI